MLGSPSTPWALFRGRVCISVSTCLGVYANLRSIGGAKGYFCFVTVFTMSVIVFCLLLVLGALDDALANCRASASALPLLSFSPSIVKWGCAFS